MPEETSTEYYSSFRMADKPDILNTSLALALLCSCISVTRGKTKTRKKPSAYLILRNPDLRLLNLQTGIVCIIFKKFTENRGTRTFFTFKPELHHRNSKKLSDPVHSGGLVS